MKICCLLVTLLCVLLRTDVLAGPQERGGVKTSETIQAECLTFSELTKLQKSQYKLYIDQKNARLNDTYKKKDFFGALYKPVADFSRYLLPLARKAAEQARKNMILNKQQGMDVLVRKFQNQVASYSKIADLCQQMIDAYQKENQSEIKKLMDSYIVLSNTMKKQGISLPKREWLTEKEAEFLYQLKITGREK